ncbi:MAG: hypothetical protein ACRY3E_02170 [Candidatus Lariskella arthropodorum]
MTNTAIDKDTDVDHKIAPAASQSRYMFEDVEEKTASIVDELRATSFENGMLVEREEVARNLLLQGLDISVIENATGLSKENLAAIQKNIKSL